MLIDNKFPNGVRFEGDKGWIFVSRGGAKATASDPKILETKIGPNEVHLHKSTDHHLDWLQAIQSRKPAVTTAEEAHRSTSACILAYIAMGIVVQVDRWPDVVLKAESMWPVYQGARWVVERLPADYRPRLYPPPLGHETTAAALLQAVPQGRAVSR